MAAQKNRTTPTENNEPKVSEAISAKATYSREAGKKLAETKTKLTRVNDKIRNAVAAGRIEASEQLGLAQQAVESNLVIAEEQLSCLRKSGEESWEDLRKDMEDAWENLSRSIKNLVDRFSDRVR